MADLIINGTTYSDINEVQIPLADGSGNQSFTTGGGSSDESIYNVIAGTATEFKSDKVTKVRGYMCRYDTNLRVVDLPNCEEVGNEAFLLQSPTSALTSVNLPKCTKIGTSAFRGQTGVKELHFPKVVDVSTYAFQSMTGLEKIRFDSRVTIYNSAFLLANNVKAIVLTSEDKCVIADNEIKSLTTFVNGEGFIYVPSSLLSAYKEHKPDFATFFRAIEDYPEVLE